MNRRRPFGLGVGLLVLVGCAAPKDGGGQPLVPPSQSNPVPQVDTGVVEQQPDAQVLAADSEPAPPLEADAAPDVQPDLAPPAAQPDTAPPIAPDAAAPAVVVRWEFPALWANGAEKVFPSYVAHLMGKTINGLELQTACAVMTNPGQDIRKVTLELRFSPFASTPAPTMDVLVTTTKRVCLNPVFEAGKLPRERTPGRIEAFARDEDGKQLAAEMVPIVVAPITQMLWTIPVGTKTTEKEMDEFSAVYVMPHDPNVDKVLRLASEPSRNVFGGFGGGDPYQRVPYARAWTLPPGTYLDERSFFEPGEHLEWGVGVISGPTAVDVLLMTQDQLAAWAAGQPAPAVMAWNNTPADSMRVVGFTPPSEGWYHFVIVNRSTSSPATVKWVRNNTEEDVARESLGAVYRAMKDVGFRYTSISDTFFTSGVWQNVRTPAEAAGALSANCIDGSLLFASVLELVGMKPVLVLKTGHMYMGVLNKSATSLWTVETTMVGDQPFEKAYPSATASTDQMDPRYHQIDVPAMRAKGILSVPSP